MGLKINSAASNARNVIKNSKYKYMSPGTQLFQMCTHTHTTNLMFFFFNSFTEGSWSVPRDMPVTAEFLLTLLLDTRDVAFY